LRSIESADERTRQRILEGHLDKIIDTIGRDASRGVLEEADWQPSFDGERLEEPRKRKRFGGGIRRAWDKMLDKMLDKIEGIIDRVLASTDKKARRK
jgi:hypothetical protein